MKNTVYKIILASVTIIPVISCQESQDIDLPLAVNSRLVKLSSSAGHTGVMIYCNSSWTATLTNGYWASLDVDEGKGNSMVNFSYEANGGFDRKTGIAFQSGNLRDTVWMYQAGNITNPVFSVGKTSLTLPSGENKSSVTLTTNIGTSISDVVAETVYLDASASGWVTDVSILETAIKISYSANTSGKERKAEIRFSIPGTETELVFAGAMIALTQKCE